MKRGKATGKAKYYWIGGILIVLALIISGALWFFPSESDNQLPVANIGNFSRFFPAGYLENISLIDLQSLPAGARERNYTAEGMNRVIQLNDGARGIYLDSNKLEDAKNYVGVWVEQTKREDYDFYSNAMLGELRNLSIVDLNMPDVLNESEVGYTYYWAYSSQNNSLLSKNNTASWVVVFFPEEQAVVIMSISLTGENYSELVDRNREIIKEMIRNSVSTF